jgi:hypothetical protein
MLFRDAFEYPSTHAVNIQAYTQVTKAPWHLISYLLHAKPDREWGGSPDSGHRQSAAPPHWSRQHPGQQPSHAHHSKGPARLAAPCRDPRRGLAPGSSAAWEAAGRTPTCHSTGEDAKGNPEGSKRRGYDQQGQADWLSTAMMCIRSSELMGLMRLCNGLT